MTAVTWVGRAIVVIAPDRPGHWTDNPALLERLAAALAAPGARRGRVEVVDRTLVRVTGRVGTEHRRVSASHEAGRVGLAVHPTAGPDGAIGFDLCADRRVASIRSALPLVLTPAEQALLPDPGGTPGSSPLGDGPAQLAVWTAVEALTKLARGRLLSPAGRPRLTSLRPPLAAGVSLIHRCLGDLTCCVAIPSPTANP